MLNPIIYMREISPSMLLEIFTFEISTVWAELCGQRRAEAEGEGEPETHCAAQTVDVSNVNISSNIDGDISLI